MDNVLDDLIRIGRRCEKAGKLFDTDPVRSIAGRVDIATKEVGDASSGSWIGYQASLYLENFRRPRGEEHFNSEWGLEPAYSNTTNGPWRSYSYEEVKAEILRRAKLADAEDLRAAADHVQEVFHENKDELVPLLDALVESHDDKVLRGLKDKLEKLNDSIDAHEWVRQFSPKVFATRDSRAQAELQRGPKPPHHIAFQAWRMHLHSSSIQVEEVAKIARHAQRYLEAKYKMKGKSIAKKDGKIFIGHGHSLAWRDLKDFVHETLGLEYDEFNREEPAGKSTTERLEEMLDAACFAFLVLTAEDEHADGSKHARENVIHEAGLFQGRLGFRKAIVLLEEGCTEFSNKAGLTYIPFPKGNIMAVSERIRAVLDRESII